MLQLRKETDYAIQFLQLLSKGRESLSLSDVARATGISFLFLQKIARRLRLAGLIKSRKGIEGGYYLARPAKNISLKKIIEVMEGKCGVLSCFEESCPHSVKCALKNKMGNCNKKIMKILEGIKLKDL